MDFEPQRNTIIAYPDPLHKNLMQKERWIGAACQLDLLKKGLVFSAAESENAITMAKAMLNFQPTQGEK